MSNEEKYEYFIAQTNVRLEKMDEKLDQLISFRFMLIGASMAVSAMVSLIITILVGK